MSVQKFCVTTWRTERQQESNTKNQKQSIKCLSCLDYPPAYLPVRVSLSACAFKCLCVRAFCIYCQKLGWVSHRVSSAVCSHRTLCSWAAALLRGSAVVRQQQHVSRTQRRDTNNNSAALLRCCYPIWQHMNLNLTSNGNVVVNERVSKIWPKTI